MPINYEPYTPPQRFPVNGSGGGGGNNDAVNAQMQALNVQAQMQSLQNNVTPSEAYQAGNQQQMQANQIAADSAQQRAQLDAHLIIQQSDLSQKEAMRLQQMKQAIADVNTSDSLSPSEKADYITQLQTGISPLEQRAAATKVKQQQLQNQQMMQQAHVMAGLTSANEATRAASFASRTIKVPQPDGSVIQGWLDHKGDFQEFKTKKDDSEEKQQKRDDLEQKRQDALQKRRDTLVDKARKEYVDADQDAHALATKQMMERDEDKKPIYPRLQTDEGYGQLHRAIMNGKGMGQNIDEHVAKRLAQDDKNSGVSGGQPAATPTAKSDAKPWNPNEPKDLTPDQATIQSAFESTRAKIMSSQLPAPQKSAYANAIEESKQLVSQYGSPDKMKEISQQAYRRYTDLKKFMETMPPLTQQAPESQTPPANSVLNDFTR